MYVYVYVFVPLHAGVVDSPLNTPLIILLQLSVISAAPGATASAGQATVDPPAAGALHTGALIVYVYTQSWVVPSHAVYVYVYVFVPLHAGVVDWSVNTPLIVRPQLSVISAAPGATASAGQATVDPAAAGALHTGALIVYVYTQ